MFRMGESASNGAPALIVSAQLLQNSNAKTSLRDNRGPHQIVCPPCSCVRVFCWLGASQGLLPSVQYHTFSGTCVAWIGYTLACCT